MANITENTQNPVWSNGIYQIETSDPVLGGANGIANRQAKELAARTQWLKTELARAVALIGTNQQTATQQFALKTTSLTAGAGLTGGGVLRDNMTLSLGTPSKITATSQNSAVSNTHTHEIDKASTSVAGIVKLNNTLTSDAQNEALTAAQGKVLSEQIASAVAGGFALCGSLGSRNLNDVIGTAHYGVWDNSLNTNATAEKNYPITKAGTLFLLPSAYQGVQLYIPFDLNIIYIRHSLSNSNNNWSSWRVIDETINALDSDSRTAALSAAMGKKLNEEKLGNSGQQTLNGNLYIVRNAWEKMRFVNTDGSYWRYETHPTPLAGNNNKRFNFVFTGTDNTEQARIAFPDPNGTQVVAYQSWVNDTKVAKSGDTMTGHLYIKADGYSSVRLHNDGERETRLETVPSRMTDIVFQIADRQGTTGGFTAYRFPNATSSQTIAYQSWVSEQLASKDSLKTVNFWQDISAVYTNSGFYRANGKQINGIAAPSMEIHIAHPSYSNNAYARGIGFGYGGEFNVVTTSWDSEGNYLGYKTVLTEENGVMLTGNQTIAGVKTFTNNIHTQADVHAGGLIATSYRNDWVGYQAKQPTEGKHGFYDVVVNNVARGGMQITSEGGGKYAAKLLVTPAGATNSDRRIAGLTVLDTAVHTQAYGWLHDYFATKNELGSKSTVAVLTGKIAHGGTIPLPAGFSQAQCKWFVSMHNSNPANLTWDLREGGLGNHHTSNVWADGNRVVTCRVYRDVQAGAGGWQNAEANYMIIGVK